MGAEGDDTFQAEHGGLERGANRIGACLKRYIWGPGRVEVEPDADLVAGPAVGEEVERVLRDGLPGRGRWGRPAAAPPATEVERPNPVGCGKGCRHAAAGPAVRSPDDRGGAVNVGGGLGWRWGRSGAQPETRRGGGDHLLRSPAESVINLLLCPPPVRSPAPSQPRASAAGGAGRAARGCRPPRTWGAPRGAPGGWPRARERGGGHLVLRLGVLGTVLGGRGESTMRGFWKFLSLQWGAKGPADPYPRL